MSWIRTTGLRLALALGLAFSLWAFVSFSNNPDRSVPFNDIPVAVENLSDGLVMVDANGSPAGSLPPINVTVTAEDQTFSNVRLSDMRAFVDLRDLGPGDYTVPINVVPTRTGLSHADLTPSPDRLPIRLEREITRTVPLTVEVSGSVPFSFRNLDPKTTSSDLPISQVTVKGPAPRVERIAQARTTANIDRLTANYNSPRPVEALDADGQPISGVLIEPPSVDVQVPIVSSAGSKRVPVVPNVTGQPGSGYIAEGVEVDPPFVVLTGSAGRLDDVSQVETAPVDLAGASGTFSRTVDLIEPSGGVIEASQPRKAVVTVRLRPLDLPFRLTLPVQVQLNGLGEGLLVTSNPTSVQVTIRGTAATLGQLSQAGLVGTLNLRGLGPGIYTLQPQVTLPQGLSLSSDVPRVTVVLRAVPTATAPPATAPLASPTPTDAPEQPSPAPTDTPAPTGPPVPTGGPATSPAPTATPAPTAAPTPAPAPTGPPDPSEEPDG